MAKLPGQASFLSLLTSSFWTILGLFILIIGHLVWAFIAYGWLTNTHALADLEQFLPILKQTHLYVLAGLAIALDIWIIISHKKERAQKIKR